ncbi:hypothetical protein AWJ20_1967 [Sugiyamaella lignohabitans]|uniref:Uncharacterized protein n=1 Tax=Sugiyamaella lignohabitans TaxID=796027 RepID=A0A167ER99_9ASCO|nr:uncharacterized protein AWJ20_1967 [Sugiyamaella lignohabitans]ANB14379.1 hypothetical protein AWJ20_1967 [Sugiyamaella lignohabitans]
MSDQRSGNEHERSPLLAYSPNDESAPHPLPRSYTISEGQDENGILMNSGNHHETVNDYNPSSDSSRRSSSKLNFNDVNFGNNPFKKRHFSYSAGGTSPSRHHSFYSQLQQHGSRISLGDAAALELDVERLENLHERRPFRLIGKSCPLRDWSRYCKTEEQIRQISRAKAIQEYYSKQNDLIERYKAIDRLLDSGIPQSMLKVYGDDIDLGAPNGTTSKKADDPPSPPGNRQGVPANIDEESNLLGGESREDKSNMVMFAIYVNFVINFVLLVGKVIVVLLTNSLSVVASLVDSILDFLSTFIIWASTRLVDQRDWKTKHLYPVGRSRLEPIGVLVFSILIIVSFLKVGDEAINKLLEGRQGSAVDIGIPSIIIMSLTIVVKVFCYLWCRTIDSSAVQALAQDAMTDIVFNTFSMLFPLVGHAYDIWWLDPFGALALSAYIIHSWASTAMEHIDNLTGSAASPEDRQVVLYLCMRFSDSIKYITALNAYHAGDRITVEVDIVLDDKYNLRDCHDIAEALQYAIETLPFVERAFVHLDYRRGNFTGHIDR